MIYNSKWTRILVEEPPASELVRRMRNVILHGNVLELVRHDEIPERISNGIGERMLDWRELSSVLLGSTLSLSSVRAKYRANFACYQRAIEVTLFGTQFQTLPFNKRRLDSDGGRVQSISLHS